MIKKLFFAFVMAVMPMFVEAKEALSVMLWPIVQAPPSYVDPEPEAGEYTFKIELSTVCYTGELEI